MPYLTKRKWVLINTVMLFGLFVSIVWCTTLGAVPVTLTYAWDAPTVDNPDYVIIVRTRLPRILLSAIVGGALGVTGASLQALLHNPLACPHILGVSGGAALSGIIALVWVGAVTALPLFWRVSVVSFAA